MKFFQDQTEAKIRGSYYTPLGIASYLAEWVISRSAKRILEPSCGDGAFIEALAKLSKSEIHLDGFEIDRVEAAKAKQKLENASLMSGSIEATDFLSWYNDSSHFVEQYDAVVGNPPFVRYQYLSEKQQENTRKIFEKSSLPFTLHTNLWVPFVIASSRLLKPGGLLALVIPSEIIHVLHASALRSFLLSSYSKVLLLDPESLLFPSALQGAMLLIAEKKAPGQSSKGISIQAQLPLSFFNKPIECYIKESLYRQPTFENLKWTEFLLSDEEISIYHEINNHLWVKKFGDIAKADVGIVTGANDFFLVSDDIVKEYGLQKRSLPMFGRSDHVKGLIYDRKAHESNKKAGLPANFIYFSEELERLSEREKSYIKLGEMEGLHLRYKCRIRSPWYKVPSIFSTKVGMLKRSHETPRLIFNDFDALSTDTSYRIKTEIDPATFVYSFVNSLTSLSAELEGRHYGGGVLELVPSEIEQLKIPLIDKKNKTDLLALHRKYTSRKTRINEIVLSQDKVTLLPYLKSKRKIDSIQNAWLRLQSRRMRKPMSAV
ncbi:Eco57I restriction-modification methylase domain-containing protein [Leptospira wolffii]|uniref:Eco57I restriction-modification methylase domain-containing protein n=1 Tax=Leptospira wolffii TaxID=409998 RepID=UPI0002ED0471|nr:N-6 DNA methylase [Leptospira wolffii]EPG66439.1 Eco57I restriction-modification methylase [Leptospira wolffii serovar Khorat str. Khorat-H2]